MKTETLETRDGEGHSGDEPPEVGGSFEQSREGSQDELEAENSNERCESVPEIQHKPNEECAPTQLEPLDSGGTG